MGRVWRDGQKKSVQIYRLIIECSIEETILRRQYKKAGLRSVLQEADIDGKTNASSVLSSDANKAEGSVEADAETSAGGVREMVLPSTSFNFTNSCSGKNAIMITTSAAATSDDVNRGSGDRILLSAAISRIVELDG